MKKILHSDIIYFCLFAAFLFFILNPNFVLADSDSNNTMTVQANIIGFRIIPIYDGVGIQVSDFIDLGNVTNSTPVSKEKTVYINNTGNVDITVTPQLADENDGILSYLFFRTHMTSNGTSVPYTRIGDYSLNISKPSNGSSVRPSQCYMILDMTDFEGPLTKNLMNYTGQVIFWAVPS